MTNRTSDKSPKRPYTAPTALYRPGRETVLAGLTLLAIGLAVYGNAIGNPFVIDDKQVIVGDARVRLTQGALQSTKDDVGFVPLLHLQGRARLSERWELLLDLDALAGGPGRAEDFAIKLGWEAAPGWRLRAGYRTVEGGADVDAVYAFAWLHYAVASVSIEL